MTKRVSSVGPTRGHSERSRNSLVMIQSGNRILCINYKMPFLSIFQTPTKNTPNIYIYLSETILREKFPVLRVPVCIECQEVKLK